MKRVLIVGLSLVLAGCSSLATIDGGHPVDCSAKLDSQTFAVPGYYAVKLNRMKTDRFGRVFYRPVSNHNVNFIGGGFKSADLFRDIECKEGKE